MTCDHVMRSGGGCGRPVGHRGNHLSPKAIQNEAERMRLRRTTPGPCTVKGCDSPRMRYPYSTKYDARCLAHKYMDGVAYRAKQRLKALGELGISVPEITIRKG
jgi:hypothetical protein